MELHKTRSFNANDIFYFFLIYNLFHFVGSKSVAAEEKRIPRGLKTTLDNTTESHHATAMDLILAVNRNTPVRRILHKENGMDAEITKRMNITKLSNGTMVITNTTEILNGTDVLLQTNLDEKVADNLLEGDILLDPLEPDDYKIIKLVKEDKKIEAEQRLQKRQASRQLKRLWHNRVVPYHIDPSLGDYQSIKLIQGTIAEFNTKSCVKFLPRRGNERDYVIFKKNDGCSSSIGRAYARPGYQVISIDEGCKARSIIMHEMLHCVGFYHEQSRPDRDKYLKVLSENIQKGQEPQFEKYSHGEIDQFSLIYNYHSIMQYGNKAFSSNNEDTMQSISNGRMVLGGEQMTNEDIMELNLLYDCKSSAYNAWTSWSSFSECDKYCYKHRQRYCYGSSTTACGGNPNTYGIETQDVKCSKDVCPAKIDGHWGKWSLYGPCNRNCDEGVRKRMRECNKPIPQNGGKDCPGVPDESLLCINPRCATSLGPYDTDFRDNHLGSIWRNDIYDTPEFDWKTHKGTTETEGTGPSRGHLGRENNYYLYIDSSGRVKDDNARLFTEHLPKTSGSCFSFYYHMYGATAGTLTLSMFSKGESNLVELFSKSGNQGDRWHSQRVDLTSVTDYQLIFEAKVADGDYSDIAIDDLFFNNGTCDCQNNFINCVEWAEKKGNCISSYDFMVAHCKRACNFCPCVDKDKNCKKIAATECKRTSKYSNWMDAMCPHTCRRCACHDENVDCAKWKNENQCKVNPSFMLKHCKRSCGVCKAQDPPGKI